MKLAKYVACICEGAAESAIIDIFVDNELLVFNEGKYKQPDFRTSFSII